MKYSIDKTLMDRAKIIKVDIKQLIRHATQLIMILDEFIDEQLENILLNIIDTYKPHTMQQLSNIYVFQYLETTEEQKKRFQKIDSNKRVNFLNEIISIAINNTKDNFHQQDKNTYSIKTHPIITQYTLNFFLNSTYKEDNINSIETILKKLRTIIEKQRIIPSYYTFLIYDIFDFYKVESEIKQILNNYPVAKYLEENFGKIYFIMNIEYSMNLTNKNKYLRSWKSKYEKIIINKYKYIVKDFIEKEFNFYLGLNKQEEAKVFLEFYQDMFIDEKLHITFFQQ